MVRILSFNQFSKTKHKVQWKEDPNISASSTRYCH